MNDVASGRSGRRDPSEEEFNRSVPRPVSGREARVGIFVLIGLLSFVTVLFLLTDPATLRGRYILVTTVEDAGGIRRGDPIQMRGVNIGRIHGFAMRTDGHVDISMEVEGKWKIPADSHTEMGSAGIFGGRTMEVIPGHAAQFFSSGDTVPAEGPSGGANLMGSVGDVGTAAKDALDQIRTLLNDTTVSAVRGSAEQLEKLLTQLSQVTSEQRSSLEKLTSNLARSAEGLASATAAGPDAAQAIAKADSVMSTLSRTSDSLDRAVASLRAVLDRIDRGEGTLGRLSTDDSLYQNLNRAAESVSALLDDVRANPKKYINVSIF
jgi:phospholipid/cholesterol/gamma-HCH transport system substrate-binding protein